MQLSVCIAIATTGFWCRIFAQLSWPSCDSASIVSSLLHQKKRKTIFTPFEYVIPFAASLDFISHQLWEMNEIILLSLMLLFVLEMTIKSLMSQQCNLHAFHASIALSLSVHHTDKRTHTHSHYIRLLIEKCTQIVVFPFKCINCDGI